MDFYTLKQHISELKEYMSCKPVILRAGAGTGRQFHFHLLTKTGHKALVFSLDAPNQSLLYTDSREDTDRNLSIVKSANRLLTDGRILSVSMPCPDRIVKLHIGVKDSYLGKRSDFYIICEFTGRIADIFLCSADHKIIDRLSRTSNNLIGDDYKLPDPKEGFPPVILREACQRGCEPEKIVSAPFRHCFIYLKDRKIQAISAFELTHISARPDYAADSVNEAVKKAEEELLIPARINELKKRALTFINSKIKQKYKLLASLKDLKIKYENSDKERDLGNLITANIYKIKQGDRFAELEDWKGGKVRVELDPARSPAANAQKHFTKYRKAKRGMAEVEKHIKELESTIKWLQEQIWLTQTASSEKDLYFEKENKPKKLASRQKSDKNPIRAKIKSIKADLETERAKYYIGRNAVQNDFLTFHLAKSSDFWFHANDVPGAHVIMKIKEGAPLEEDLVQGALLAAQNSFAKDSSKAAVDYTQIQNVKRIPGGGPGQVNYTNQKTIFVKLTQ